MEGKTIIFQWLGHGVNSTITKAIEGYEFLHGKNTWQWLIQAPHHPLLLERDIVIPVPGKDKRICRVGDYVIINPDGTYFQDLTYLSKYLS